MNEDTALNKQVEQFIREEIDTVPHLEALLLLRSNRSRSWTVDDMAAALYVSQNTARDVLYTLARRHFAAIDSDKPDSFHFDPGTAEREKFIEQVEIAYKRNLVRISRMIHSKAAPAIREFAQAFRFTKERD